MDVEDSPTGSPQLQVLPVDISFPLGVVLLGSCEHHNQTWTKTTERSRLGTVPNETLEQLVCGMHLIHPHSCPVYSRPASVLTRLVLFYKSTWHNLLS